MEILVGDAPTHRCLEISLDHHGSDFFEVIYEEKYLIGNFTGYVRSERAYATDKNRP